jgi:hypothetical protein
LFVGEPRPLQQNPRIEAKEAGHRTWFPLLVM